MTIDIFDILTVSRIFFFFSTIDWKTSKRFIKAWEAFRSWWIDVIETEEKKSTTEYTSQKKTKKQSKEGYSKNFKRRDIRCNPLSQQR
ncbi:MAG: hypothetical protein GY714_24775 [Desulfobacterales bacterium]|nr:hypothetical protein [Desulfobacterales bacterium]